MTKPIPPPFDPRDPDPWQALELDQSLPLSDTAKRALLSGQRSWSRRVLLPLVRPLARLTIVLVQLLRFILPARLSAPRLLHRGIYWGLKYFVRPDANRLILRHFNIGTEILAFIAANARVEISSTVPLRPRNLEDLIDNVFLQHDLNIYNFILELNTQLRQQGRELEPAATLDFSAISDGEFDIEALPNRWHNCIDLQTAIELYTPLYGLLLSDQDFWRASNSLQLDETVAIYVSKLLNDPLALSLVHNRHPLVPLSTLEAGFRLMLHGLDAETLYGHLQRLKAAAR